MKSGIIVLVLTGLLGMGLFSHPAASQEAAGGPATAALEAWVKGKVAAGDIADLTKFAEPDELRPLRASFIKALLTDNLPGFKAHHHGVRVKNAVITGKLDLECANVPHNVLLENCAFTGDLNFHDSRFEHNLDLRGSVIQGDTYWLGIKVEKNLYLQRTVFNHGFNISGGVVGGSLNAEKARFKGLGGVYFSGLNAGKSVYLGEARFQGAFYFRMAKIGGLLAMNQARFYQKAEFRSTKVEYTFTGDGARFYGDLDAGVMKIGNDVSFNEAVFLGGVNFTGAEVGRGFYASKAYFLNPVRDAGFSHLKVGHIARFNDSHFYGPVDWDNMSVALELQAVKARFLNEKKGFEAAGLKVGTIANFTEALFRGPVRCGSSSFKGQLNARQARFEHQEYTDFSYLEVGELACFTDAVFRAAVTFKGSRLGVVQLGWEQDPPEVKDRFMPEVSFEDCRLTDLKIAGAATGRTDISLLNLEKAEISRGLALNHARIDRFKASGLQVKGRAVLQQVDIAGEAHWRDAGFANLEMSRVSWPGQAREQVCLSGMTYQVVEMEAPQPPSWPARMYDRCFSRTPLLNWIEDSPFDKRNYLQLAAYYERTGKTEYADKTFIALKRREIWPQCWYEWLNPGFWFTLIFWDLPVGYGRKPLRIVWIALPFFLLGTVLFNPRYVTGVDWPKKGRFHELLGRMLLSVDKFTPSLLNLGLEKHWQPPDPSTGLQVYIFVHMLMGRIFIAVFFFGVWEYFK